MKFVTPQEKDLLNRLTHSPDFKDYVRKLGEDFEKAVETLVLCPPEAAEVNRGVARNLYQLLKDLTPKQ
jgi:hypothetical protein